MNRAELASSGATRPLRRPRTLLSWWRREIARTVDHAEVLDRVEEDARWSGHYLFMILVSAGIAVLGLLLSSPAVVIGAMLISPMMGPIIGLGFGVALFDERRISRALLTLGGGILVAILFCALITLASPLQTVTPEIAARTRPNLFDLGVAMLSGAAGTYAMIRGRHGAIVGVAIAVAVMPPLAAIGFGLASTNRTIVTGAAFLFFTNLTAISLTAAVLARLYGFGHQLSPRQGWLQAILIVSGIVALALPLGFALRQIGWEGVASRQIRDAIVQHFGDGARVSTIEVDFDGKPMAVDAVVFTPREIRGSERTLAGRLSEILDRPVGVTVEQVKLGGLDVETGELAAARGSVGARQASEVAERLALAAGVAADQVLLDRVRRVARVAAAPIPGADLPVYRELERRVGEASPGWTVVLAPPLLPLPEPEAEGALSEGQIELVAWAARRLNLPVEVPAGSEAAVADALRQRGVQVEVGDTSGADEVRWGGVNR